MQPISVFQVDAFTDKLFHGNPAAVCILSEWFNDELLQAIAIENNLSETAFILEGHDCYHIRWFTPNGEVSLCGHATLAAGFILFELGRAPQDVVNFSSLSGILSVHKKGDRYMLDFPALPYQNLTQPLRIASLINKEVIEAVESSLDYLFHLPTVNDVAQAKIDLELLADLPKRGLIITTRAEDCDFYSRCFYPKHHVPEDPVTGSAHCLLTPFWSERLGKTTLKAKQGLVRQGELTCQWIGERVSLYGHCRLYLKGYLQV